MKHPLCEPLSCPGVKKIGTAGLQGLGFLIPGTSPKSGFGAHVTMLFSYVRVVHAVSFIGKLRHQGSRRGHATRPCSDHSSAM